MTDPIPITERDLATKEGRIKWGDRCRSLAISADMNFQKESTEDFQFEAGKQWKATVILEMKGDGREPITFNLVKVFVDLIMGIKEQNDIIIKATPTEKNDAFLCEVLNKLKDKVEAMFGAETEIRRSFHSMVVCGRGWMGLDIRLDPANPLEIKIVIEMIPYDQLRRDPAGKRNDLRDASWIVWDKWLTVEEFSAAFPKKESKIEDLLTGSDVSDSISDDPYAEDGILTSGPHGSDHERPLSGGADIYQDRIRVHHMEYRENYDRFYGWNPITGATEEFEKVKLKKLKDRIPEFEYITVKDSKIKWLQWSGDEELYYGDSKNKGQMDGFSVVGCFGYEETLEGGRVDHYGVIRPLKDPQRDINKRDAQTRHLLMKQGQGGERVEIDGPLSIEQYEESKHDPGSTTWMRPGALAEGKVQEKGMPDYPVASEQILQTRVELLKFISGINPDLLGVQGRGQEPGVVVRLRQQQGLTILNPILTAYRDFRIQFTSKIFHIILAHMPDSQIQRILGSDDKFQIQDGVIRDAEKGFEAPIRDIKNLKYNVDYEESPANLTRTMYELAIYMDAKKAGFYVPEEVIIEKSGLPITEKQKWLESLQKFQQNQMQMAQLQIQLEQSKVQLEQMSIQQQGRIEGAKIQQSARKMEMEGSFELMKMDREDQQFAIEIVQEMMARFAAKRKMEQEGAMALNQYGSEPKRLAQGRA
jgi:hypothetical protein